MESEKSYLWFALWPLFILLVIRRLRYSSNQKLLPPSPLALPIIGHLYLIKNKPLHQALNSLLAKHGPILSLRFGSRPVLVISSPSAVEECFTKNDITFASRPHTVAAEYFTYNRTAYPFASYGQLWRIHRRYSVVEIFSSKALLKSSSALETEVSLLLRRLFRASDRKVDLNTLFSVFKINFTMRLVVGRPGTSNEVADLEFLSEFKRNFFPTIRMTVCDFFPILRLIDVGGIEKSFAELQKSRDKYLQNLIDEIRSNKNRGKQNMSLIENLLSAQQSDPQFYTDNVIKSFILIMFIAGVETTTVTLEWAMSLLLNNPEAMHKVRSEIDSHVSQGCVNESDLVNLPYLRSVISETLRLYPPAPLLLPHFSTEDCLVGGYNIPKGTMLIVNAWGMHRDPKLWDEPSKFKPERFMKMDREGFKYLPFGIGRRACPGAAMAIRTVCLVLGSLIQCFDLDKVGQENVDMSENVGVSLTKAKPLVAGCTPRQSMVEFLSQL